MSTIDWGDGTVQTVPDITVHEVPGEPGVPTTGTVSGTYAYDAPGVYAITNAKDSFGRSVGATCP